MLKKLTILLAVAMTALVGASAAFAYTMDADGKGFVGKGEVQTVLGFNNKQMQAAHTAVTFNYVASTTYEFDCEWDTGTKNITHHVNTKEATTQVNAAVASDSRKTGQWTGWNLLGFSGGAANPVAEPTDADCGAEGNAMKTIVPGSVELISSSGSLYAVHNGASYLLTPTV